MIEIEFIFRNDRAYNICMTMSYIINLFHNDHNPRIPYSRYQEIILELRRCKFDHYVPGFIVGYDSGVYLPTDEWLILYGIEEDITEWVIDDPMDDTIETFSMTESQQSALMTDVEEEITEEEEEDLIIGHHIIVNLSEVDSDMESLLTMA
jgi:hypothetical protein